MTGETVTAVTEWLIATRHERIVGLRRQIAAVYSRFRFQKEMLEEPAQTHQTHQRLLIRSHVVKSLRGITPDYAIAQSRVVSVRYRNKRLF